MLKDYLIDTNIIISHLKGDINITSFLLNLEKQSNFYTSVLNKAEVDCGLFPEETSKADMVFDKIKIYDVTITIANIGSSYYKRYNKSHGITLVDAIIAGTAKHYNIALITMNKKHFPMDDITVINP